MNVRIVHRPVRATPVLRPPSKISLEDPSALAEGSNEVSTATLCILPLPDAGCSTTVMMLFRHSSLTVIGALMMVITILASAIMMLSQRSKAVRNRREIRDVYLEYLEGQRDKMRSAKAKQLADAHHIHSALGGLLSIVMSPSRLWGHRRGDSNFLAVRLEVSIVPSHEIKVKTDDNVRTCGNPSMVNGTELVKSRLCGTPDTSVLIALDPVGTVSIAGGRVFVMRTAQLIATQATAFHLSEGFQLAPTIDDNYRSEWN